MGGIYAINVYIYIDRLNFGVTDTNAAISFNRVLVARQAAILDFNVST